MKNTLILSVLALSIILMPINTLAYGHGDKEGKRVRVTAQAEARVEGQRGWWNGWKNWMPQARPANSCEAMEARIDSVIDKYDNNTDRKVNAHLALKTKVAEFEANAAAGGYNTADLRASMPGLDTRVDAFAADYAEYIASLKTLRTYDCDDANAEFTAQLATAKQLLAEARTSAAEAKAYYKDEIKPDIAAIWAQIKVDYNFNFSL